MLKNVIVKTAWWKLYGENCKGKTVWWKLHGENCKGKTVWGKLHGENCMVKTARGKLYGENYHGDKCLWWKRLHGEKCMGITTWWKLHGENDLGGNCYALMFMWLMGHLEQAQDLWRRVERGRVRMIGAHTPSSQRWGDGQPWVG